MDDVSSVLVNYDLVETVQAIQPLLATGKNNHLLQIITDKTRYVLKYLSSPMYNEPAAIAYEIQLLQHFDHHIDTFRVPLPIATIRERFFVPSEDGYFVILPYIEGTPLDFRSSEGIRLLAQVYSEMHAVADRIPLEARKPRPVKSPFYDFFDFACSHCDVKALTPQALGISKPDKALVSQINLWNEQASILQHFIDTDYRTLPQQIYHNDITPANTLVRDDVILMVLDFEFMTHSARALDLATGLRYVMRVWENQAPWQSIRIFFDEYHHEHALTHSEVNALPRLLQLRAAIAIIWWLGQGHRGGQIVQLLSYYEDFVLWLDANYTTLCDVVGDCAT